MAQDTILFDTMSPDSSDYEKGLKSVTNLLPADANGWREVRALAFKANLALPASSSLVGSFSDPNGTIYVGSTRTAGPSSRLLSYVDSPAAFTNRTPGVDFAGAPSWWTFAKFGDSVIAAPWNVGTGAAIQLQVRTGAAATFANLVTSADRPAPKFLAVSRSHVIGAHNLANGGAGLYAAANPYRFMWCARNNAAVWTPGTDRAGFAQVDDDLGEITGAIGFKDYALIFQQFGVTRLSWIGGDAVWQQDELAAHDFGLGGNASFRWPSIVRAQRAAYYVSNRGPAVTNGESAQFLGEGVVRRELVDPQSSNGWSFTKPITSAYSSDGYVAWLGEFRILAGGKICTVYHVPTGRWSLINDFEALGASSPPEVLGVVKTGTPAYSFDGMRLFNFNAAVNEINAWGFTSATATMTATLATKRWRPSPGTRASITGVRPIFLLDLLGGAYPTVTIFVTGYNEARTAVFTETLTTADADANGVIQGAPLPLSATEFRFSLSIPTLGAAPTIRELTGLEIFYDEVSIF
ncbi:MAG TPA: hypothetical protein VJ725_34695 [Thermoanaerobaculia bacterium]|nr:hypothetical protein [Thermoanaerobaculia bacterium]